MRGAVRVDDWHAIVVGKEFDSWQEARTYAERRARETRQAHGIEKPWEKLPDHMQKWTVKMLPNKENRYGWERRCEAVEPEDGDATMSTVPPSEFDAMLAAQKAAALAPKLKDGYTQPPGTPAGYALAPGGQRWAELAEAYEPVATPQLPALPPGLPPMPGAPPGINPPPVQAPPISPALMAPVPGMTGTVITNGQVTHIPAAAPALPAAPVPTMTQAQVEAATPKKPRGRPRKTTTDPATGVHPMTGVPASGEPHIAHAQSRVHRAAQELADAMAALVLATIAEDDDE